MLSWLARAVAVCDYPITALLRMSSRSCEIAPRLYSAFTAIMGGCEPCAFALRFCTLAAMTTFFSSTTWSRVTRFYVVCDQGVASSMRWLGGQRCNPQSATNGVPLNFAGALEGKCEGHWQRVTAIAVWPYDREHKFFSGKRARVRWDSRCHVSFAITPPPMPLCIGAASKDRSIRGWRSVDRSEKYYVGRPLPSPAQVQVQCNR